MAIAKTLAENLLISTYVDELLIRYYHEKV